MGRGYRCLATSVEGFVQQLAASYLRHGYWWYACGVIPEWKNCALVDQKLISKYDIGISESTRARRKRAGKANLQYLRHDRFFVLLATKGEHEFYEHEAGAIRDIRRVPIKFHGYSISYRPGGRTRTGEEDPRWHAHVEIERSRYKELRARLLELAVHRSAERLALEFYRLPFEAYAPVRRQMLNLLRAVNRARKVAGYSLLPPQVLPLRRRVVRPFEVRQVPQLVCPMQTAREVSCRKPLSFRDETLLEGLSVRFKRPENPLQTWCEIRRPIAF